MLNYKAIEIFTSEQARSGHKPVIDAVIEYIHDLKIAARCIVTRGISGCYESGEVATGRLEILSYNLPVRIYIVVPTAAAERVLSGLDSLVGDGVIALHDLNVVRHRTHNAFFPRQFKVRDVMTPDPKSVSLHSPLCEAAQLLLSSIFTGLPVTDDEKRPIGVITQGDLMRKGGLPLRLGLLAESDQNCLETLLHQLSLRQVEQAMSSPVVTIADDRPLAEAVKLMLTKDVKRLPVVDQAGRLTGMLSRLDIFRTVMREAPDWKAFQAQKIEVAHLKQVKDIVRRDTHTVLPQTPLNEVVRMIDTNDIQRVAVVDVEGRLLGLISDRDLLRYFQPEQTGIMRLFSKAKHSLALEWGHDDLEKRLSETRAEAVMTTDLITGHEEMLIEEVIGLMTQKTLKRLPIVDGHGRFLGMVSRDSLLRTGFGALL